MEAIDTDSGKQSLAERYFAHTPRLGVTLFTLFTTTIVVWAWLVRDYRYLQPEEGFGYALGITGASLMAVLLLYPLRKRWRVMQRLMKVKSWFRMHMMLGVIGPLCILLHSNFQLGSANSSIALSAMLLVAGSGLVGRYLYGKFHYGVYGQQVELMQLKSDLDIFYQKIDLSSIDEPHRQALNELYDGTNDIINSHQSAVSLRQLIKQRHWLQQKKRVALPPLISSSNQSADKPEAAIQDHVIALGGLLEKLAGLRLFERLFGLWHVIHLPFFILMIVTAIVHIVVVHWY